MTQTPDYKPLNPFNPYKEVASFLNEKQVAYETLTTRDAYGLVASMKKTASIAVVKEVKARYIDNRTISVGDRVFIETYNVKKMIKDFMAQHGIKYAGFGSWEKLITVRPESYEKDVAQALVETALAIKPAFDIVIIITDDKDPFAPAFKLGWKQ